MILSPCWWPPKRIIRTGEGNPESKLWVTIDITFQLVLRKILRFFLLNNVIYKGKKYRIIMHYANQLKPKIKCRNIYGCCTLIVIFRKNCERAT